MGGGADGFSQFAAGLQFGQYIFRGGCISGHFLAVGQAGGFALALQLEIVQVRADNVDLLVEHRKQLLPALDILAKLH